MGVLKPELIMKSIIPVVMAGILGIYGMIVAVILAQKSKPFFHKKLLDLAKSQANHLHFLSGIWTFGFRNVLRT